MSNYTLNQYVNDQNNSWSMVFNFVPKKTKVLDIGCSSGNFGAELIAQKGCTVDGIDIDAKDARLAKAKLRNAWHIDIETASLDFTSEKYDVVLMMDVIEHLKNPPETLKKISSLLRPKGFLIFSVPNMAHISVRLDLLKGNFNYNQTGLLDNTHLHFYTEETLKRVLALGGYSLEEMTSTSVSYPKQIIEKKLKEVGLQYSSEFKNDLEKTNGSIYQFVGIAEVGRTDRKIKPLPKKHPHERHFDDIERAMESQHQQIIRLKADILIKNQRNAELEKRINKIVNSKLYKIAKMGAAPYLKVRKRVGK